MEPRTKISIRVSLNAKGYVGFGLPQIVNWERVFIERGTKDELILRKGVKDEGVSFTTPEHAGDFRWTRFSPRRVPYNIIKERRVYRAIPMDAYLSEDQSSVTLVALPAFLKLSLEHTSNDNPKEEEPTTLCNPDRPEETKGYPTPTILPQAVLNPKNHAVVNVLSEHIKLSELLGELNSFAKEIGAELLINEEGEVEAVVKHRIKGLTSKT